MSTSMESEERRGMLPLERSIQLAPWAKLNARMGLRAVTLLLVVIVFVGGGLSGFIAVALILDVFLLVAHVVVFELPLWGKGRLTLATNLFRKTRLSYNQKTGRLRYRSNQPGTGERFGLEGNFTPDQIKRRQSKMRYSRMLGRVEFIPFLVDEDDPFASPDEAPLQEAGPEDKPPSVQTDVPPPEPLGIAADARYRTLTGSMWAAGISPITLDPDNAEGQLDAFSRLLDLVDEREVRLHRIVWQVQTIVGEIQDPNEVLGELQEKSKLTSRLTADDPVMRRIREMSERSVQHLTKFNLSVYKPEVRNDAKEMGSPEAVLADRVISFFEAATEPGGLTLRGAGLLSYNELVLYNRLMLDPVYAQSELVSTEKPGGLVNPELAWPGFEDFEPHDHCWLGSTCHIGFFVADTPRKGLTPKQFWKIQQVAVPKTITTVVQMVPPKWAQQRAEFETTGAAGVNVDRRQAARRITESQAMAAEEATRHEREQARTDNQVGRTRIFIDVHGASLREAKDNAAKVKRAAASARIRLEPLDGRQDLGIEALMPACRGLAAINVPDWMGY